MLTINGTKREDAVGSQTLRAEGRIPAVFYGPKQETTSISISEVDFMKIYREAGESSIITIKEGNTEHEALIHEIQWDAVTQKPIHVDFYVIEKGKKVEISVPIEFIGESDAVLKLGGVLVKVMHEIEVEALPKDLPQHIDVDISSLVDFDSQIKVGDVKFAEGVDIISEADEVIALVQEAKEEEPEPEAMTIEDIEVEGKKPEDEEAEPKEEAAK
jgi:large subunit ribosomal protein L25